MSGLAVTPSFQSSFLRWMPLLTPAIKEGGYEIDQELIATRKKVALVAAFLFSILGFGMGLLFANPLMCLPAIGIAFAVLLTLLFEEGIAKRAIDPQAVDEFVSKDDPDKKAIQWIQGSVRAADLFHSDKTCLNKAYKYSLLLAGKNGDSLPSLEVLQHLMNHGFDLQSELSYVWSEGTYSEHISKNRLHYILGSPLSTPAHIECALKGTKRERFSPHETVTLWMAAKTQTALAQIKAAGFDINAQDEEGHTCLHKIALRQFSVPSMGYVALLKWFLDNGADPSIRTYRDQSGIGAYTPLWFVLKQLSNPDSKIKEEAEEARELLCSRMS
jgi:hypothetical protein